MDEAGSAIEDFGSFGGWKNNIGNLNPNKGYKVNMLSAGTITIPARGTKSAVIPSEILASSHFQKVFIGNGTDHMNINLFDLSKGKFEIGDEIGIFDGETCVGSAQIGSDQMLSDQISIPASCDDGLATETDGFTPGNQVSVRLFRNNQEYLINPILLQHSNNIFRKGETMFAKVSADLAIGITNLTESVSIKCYPNPFTDQLTIEIASSDLREMDVKIFDISGQLIRYLYQGYGIERRILIWDGKNDQGKKVAQGSYYLKANDKVEKIILSH